MTSNRRTALCAGLFYLLTFASSIPALSLLAPVLHDRTFVLGSGALTGVRVGLLLDLVNAAACVGTAVVLYETLRPYGAAALGFVTSRVLEAAIIVVGVVSLLGVVTLRQHGGDAATLQVVATGMVAVRDWTFLLGPGLMAGINALLLGSLMYRSRLVPRAIPLVGLIGAPFHLVAVLASLFGINDQLSLWSGISAAPIALWELSLGLWLTVRGFSRSRVLGN